MPGNQYLYGHKQLGMERTTTNSLVPFQPIPTVPTRPKQVKTRPQLSIFTSSPRLDSPIGFVLQTIENVRSIICQWVRALGVILFLFLALYSLSRVSSVAHWHGFPGSVGVCCISPSFRVFAYDCVERALHFDLSVPVTACTHALSFSSCDQLRRSSVLF